MDANPQNQKQKQAQCTKIYCGDQEELPEGYHMFGSRAQCLRKGVGTGMFITRKKVAKEQGWDEDAYVNHKQVRPISPPPSPPPVSVEPEEEKPWREEEEKPWREEKEREEKKQLVESGKEKLKRDSRSFLDDNIEEVLDDHPKIATLDELFASLADLAQYHMYYTTPEERLQKKKKKSTTKKKK